MLHVVQKQLSDESDDIQGAGWLEPTLAENGVYALLMLAREEGLLED